MSDRMVSCVRLFAFRKDISMNNKDRKRQIAYEVLMILGSLALLTFICRLWPILLLIILGIFVAAIRLLFLSGNRVDPVEPQPLLPAPISAPTESDLRKLAHSLITNRVTTLVLNVMIVRKDSPVLIPILMTQSSTVDIRDMPGATWRDVIAAVLETCKEPVALSFLYEQIEPHKKAQSNKWWKEKIRQTLQINPMHFTHDGRGLWSLNRNAA